MEGEVGRFTFLTHTVEDAHGACYNTATAFFPDLHGEQWYRTRGFKEIALLQGGVERSYRKTAALINRIRHQPEATPARTLQQASEAEGQRLDQALEQKAAKILETAGFTAAGTPLGATTRYGPRAPYRLAAKTVADAVAEAVAGGGADPSWQDDIAANPVPYEDPARTAQVTIDDVGVKQQKEQRTEKDAGDRAGAGGKDTATHYVHNTIIHV